MEVEGVDDAMVLLQESVKTIVNTTNRISAFESTNRDVVTALNDITSKISSMEAKIEDLGKKTKEPKATIKPSLLTKVAN